MFKKEQPMKRPKLSIAPLLDMIFILLIFFVVSTTFSKLPGIKINRPDATMTDQLPLNNVMVGITKNGQFYINKQQLDQHQLKNKMKIKKSQNSQLSVVIIADEDSAIKYAVQVMDICKQVGIDQISIAEEIVK